MKNVYKNRLLLLASFLEQLPEEKFNYRYWVSEGWDGKSEIGCGTTACALGWATTIPQLADAGLMMVLRGGNTGAGVVCCRQEIADGAQADFTSPRRASKEVFDLSLDEHRMLFIPMLPIRTEIYGMKPLDLNASAKDVSVQIRTLVANKYPGE